MQHTVVKAFLVTQGPPAPAPSIGQTHPFLSGCKFVLHIFCSLFVRCDKVQQLSRQCNHCTLLFFCFSVFQFAAAVWLVRPLDFHLCFCFANFEITLKCLIIKDVYGICCSTSIDSRISEYLGFPSWSRRELGWMIGYRIVCWQNCYCLTTNIKPTQLAELYC